MTNYLDQSITDELKLIMQEDITLLYESYLTDCEIKLSKLVDFAAKNQTDQVRRVVHSIKGSSQNVGAVVLAALCEKLEQAAKQQQSSAFEGLVLQIKASFKDTRSQIVREFID